MNPEISVVICTFNRADYIAKTIDSVLRQSFNNLEIIVIDDASIDNTAIIVDKLIKIDSRIKYFKNKVNLGIAKSRNRGVSLSAGKFIAMLDSDDYWLDDKKLEKQLDLLNENNLGLVGTGIILVYENGKELKKDIFKTEDSYIRGKILSKNQFAQSSVVFRKEAFIEAGGYDESLLVCEDLDLWLRIGQKYKFANLIEPCVAYLIHSAGISKKNKRKIALTTDSIIEKYKNYYPNYLSAKMKSWLRIIISL